jgi:tripartite-type tricarboxylate transporter receptor subunit TctC
MRTAVTAVTACAVAALAAALPAAAQPYPAKPIRFIVPLAAGGNLDIVTRAIALKVGEQVGYQSIVENRPGAASLVGTQYVAKQPADGYTVLGMANTFVTAPYVMSTAGYDPIKEFAGVSLTALIPQILIVNVSLPAKSVKELIALAKARPGQLAYGSAGSGATAHIAGELFDRQAGTKMQHIPYKGSAPALVDIVGGQIALMFDQISTSIPYIDGGRLRALAVTTKARSPVYPNLPTVAEAGLPGYEMVTYNGIIAPVGTPRDALTRLNAEINKAVQTPELRARYLQQGIELTASPSYEEFTTFLRNDAAKMARLVKEAGIKVD